MAGSFAVTFEVVMGVRGFLLWESGGGSLDMLYGGFSLYRKADLFFFCSSFFAREVGW